MCVQWSPVECVSTFLIKRFLILLCRIVNLQTCRRSCILHTLLRRHREILPQHFIMLAYHMSVLLPTHPPVLLLLLFIYFFFLRSGCCFSKGCLGRPNGLGKQTPEAEEMQQVQLFNLIFLKHSQVCWEGQYTSAFLTVTTEQLAVILFF